MSTTVAAVITMTPPPTAFFPQQDATRKQRSPAASKRTAFAGDPPLKARWVKAKAAADGGFVLFKVGGCFAAFFTDAEVIGKALGVGPCLRDGVKSLTLTPDHLNRNLRMLRAAGHDDIWLVDCDGPAEPVDDLGALDAVMGQYIRALGQRPA
jgi:hypothetical protein